MQACKAFIKCMTATDFVQEMIKVQSLAIIQSYTTELAACLGAVLLRAPDSHYLPASPLYTAMIITTQTYMLIGTTLGSQCHNTLCAI